MTEASRARILIVDDDPLTRLMAGEALTLEDRSPVRLYGEALEKLRADTVFTAHLATLLKSMARPIFRGAPAIDKAELLGVFDTDS